MCLLSENRILKIPVSETWYDKYNIINLLTNSAKWKEKSDVSKCWQFFVTILIEMLTLKVGFNFKRYPESKLKYAFSQNFS